MYIPIDYSSYPCSRHEAVITMQTKEQWYASNQFDEALWKDIEEHAQPYFRRSRELWINSEQSKRCITSMREIFRRQPSLFPILSPLNSRTTAIGLSLAASLGNRDAVTKILASSEFKKVQSNLALDHALFFAAFSGEAAAIPVLIENGASVNGCCYRSIGSPLQAAVKTKDPDLVEMLLLEGAKCDKYGSQGSALHIAAAEGSSEEIVQHLLDCGYQVDNMGVGPTKGICHETPLCTAALNGKEEMVIYFLNHGADINKIFDECAFKFTPLRNAAKLGNVAAIQMLLDYKAHP